MTIVNVKTSPNVAFFILPTNGFTVKNDTFYLLNIDILGIDDLNEVYEGLGLNLLIGNDPDTTGTKNIVLAKIKSLTTQDILINDLYGVEILNPEPGQLLAYIDGKWRNMTVGGENPTDGIGYSGIVDIFSDLPIASANVNKFFYVKNGEGTRWLPGSIGGTYRKSGTYLSIGSEWITDINPFQATQHDVDEGLVLDRFVTPSTLENAHKWTTKAQLNADGVVDIEYGGTASNNKNGAFNNLAPAQAGNDGALLTTDGSNTQWTIELSGGNF